MHRKYHEIHVQIPDINDLVRYGLGAVKQHFSAVAVRDANDFSGR